MAQLHIKQNKLKVNHYMQIFFFIKILSTIFFVFSFTDWNYTTE